MIWLIGARWKHGNVWSRSVLIGPLPFYAQIIWFVFIMNHGNLEETRLAIGIWFVLFSTNGNIEKVLQFSSHLMDINSDFRTLFGAHSAGEIPVYIPNTEVKPSRGDYTAPSGKLARCQIIRASHPNGWLFVVLLEGTKIQLDQSKHNTL